ncbi:MAG: hypothetical protein IVW51_06515 [Thermaceae bacterium]|nr:hypothetical protein [Thermaceae bacterium]
MNRPYAKGYMAEGAKTWIFPDGYLPAQGPEGNYVGHDCICMVNTSDQDASVLLDIFLEDREPVLDIEIRLPAQRSLHLRMDKPEMLGGYELPRETPYSARVRSNVPIVAQYSRLDVTQPNMAFLSVMGFAVVAARLRKPRSFTKNRKPGKVRTSRPERS